MLVIGYCTVDCIGTVFALANIFESFIAYIGYAGSKLIQCSDLWLAYVNNVRYLLYTSSLHIVLAGIIIVGTIVLKVKTYCLIV